MNFKSVSRLLISTLAFIVGCTTTGPVETQLQDSLNQLVKTPPNFVSPDEALKEGVELFRNSRNLKDKARLATALLELYRRQNSLESQLANGELLLTPGTSYQFHLQSFCVHAGKNRPFDGDGLFAAPLKGSPVKWLPQILNYYTAKKVPQQDAQVLIWSLLSGAKYDELTAPEKESLRKFFPNAALEFGNRYVEDNTKAIINSLLPSPVIDGLDKLQNLKSLATDTHNSFAQIEDVFAPAPDHASAIPVSWFRTPEGLMMHLDSNGYQEVGVKIYVPQSAPSGIRFKPSDLVAIPSQGQRLAISPNANSYEKRFIDPAMQSVLKLFAGRDLQNSELQLIKKYPGDAIRGYLDAHDAVEKTGSIFKSFDSLHNNEADAFRHFYWASRFSSHVGIDQANKFLSAHEDEESQPNAEKAMDLFNNSMGEKFIQDFQRQHDAPPNSEEITQRGLELLRQGHLKVIDPTGTVPEARE